MLFRSESRSAQSAVNGWTGDAPHLNTMISPNLTEIGAGVAVANGRVYYVIDCARPTTSEAPQESDSIVGAGSTASAREVPIPTAVVSTPNASGEVIHEVQAGQSLWQIAIAYEVKIDDIKRLNNLSGNDIYPGNRLLIKTGVILPAASPTETPTGAASASPTPRGTFTATPYLPTVTVTTDATPIVLRTSNQNRMTIGIVMGIITLAILGGVFSMLGGPKK